MQKVQHYTKPKELINPLTGTVVTEQSEVKELSQEKSIVNVKRRELDHFEKGVDKLLEPHVLKAFESGEKTFMGFWKLQKGSMRFKESLFLQLAPEKDVKAYLKVKKLMDKPEYYAADKPSIRYPKS